MGKMKDITPERFRCGPSISACPAVRMFDPETYVIIGKRAAIADEDDHLVAPGEVAVEISSELLEGAINDRLRAREARLREALEFYADRRNWIVASMPKVEGVTYESQAENDAGHRARAALEDRGDG